MSYQTGTATGPADLMSKLNTFLTGTPGWTADLFSAGNSRAVWSKAGVSSKVHVKWDSSQVGLMMIQTFNGDVDWTAQGGGEFVNNSIVSNRQVNIMTGPYPSYHFFEDDDYVHVVVERSTGIYRHLGFGQMIKLGKWTGGMYCYGHYWDQGTSHIDNPISNNHAAVFSGKNYTNATRGEGLHAEGLPGQVGKYLRHTTSLTQNDDDGIDIGNMFSGGWADGPNVIFMSSQASELNGFKPLIPIPVFYWDFGAAPDNSRILGHIPDMRSINLFGLSVAEELTIGSDTWVVFPITRKGNNGSLFNQEQSYNFGVAYKKVTT